MHHNLFNNNMVVGANKDFYVKLENYVIRSTLIDKKIGRSWNIVYLLIQSVLTCVLCCVSFKI